MLVSTRRSHSALWSGFSSDTENINHSNSAGIVMIILLMMIIIPSSHGQSAGPTNHNGDDDDTKLVTYHARVSVLV